MCGDCHEGPRRGRLHVPALPAATPALRGIGGSDTGVESRRPFTGLQLCPFGDIGALSKSDFEVLVRAGGGTVVSEPSGFLPMSSSANQTAVNQHQKKRKGGMKQMILTSPTSPKHNHSDCLGKQIVALRALMFGIKDNMRNLSHEISQYLDCFFDLH